MGTLGLLLSSDGFHILACGGFKIGGADGSGIGAVQLGAHDGLTPGSLEEITDETGIGKVAASENLGRQIQEIAVDDGVGALCFFGCAPQAATCAPHFIGNRSFLWNV